MVGIAVLVSSPPLCTAMKGRMSPAADVVTLSITQNEHELHPLSEERV
jgi:hypothetical protein